MGPTYQQEDPRGQRDGAQDAREGLTSCQRQALLHDGREMGSLVVERSCSSQNHGPLQLAGG